MTSETPVEETLRAAEAVIAFMRKETRGNTITIDGCLDTPGHKRIWRAHGPRALKLARSALNERPQDVRCAAAYADAFMFEGSAKGLVKQALTGAGAKFKENALRVQRLDPTFDAGVGYTLEGCFYIVAPWPVKNPQKAMALLKRAVHVAPHSRRNRYTLAVCSYITGDLDLAKSEFQATLKCRPSGNDVDFADFLEHEAHRVLSLL
mmetsp:Transcript_5215/g.17089  ORF Transcript_5215/g.17089 Transcript_5215/m.17089 type:complete len:207 (+) Transcript_5215:100-720(+)